MPADPTPTALPPGPRPAARPAAAPAAALRMTLHPGTDLDVAPGVPLRDLRRDLASLARRPELLTHVVAADGTTLHDDHVTGSWPLVPGATLRARPATPGRADDRSGEVPAEVAALRAPWHVAVTSGPGAGALVAVEDAPRDVGPLRVVRRRRTRRGGQDRVVVRAPRAARWAPRPGRRARHRFPRPGGRTWRPGATVEVGGTTYELRARPALAEHTFAARLAPPPADAPEPHRQPLGATLAMALLPAAASVALATVYRQPMFLVFALVGPLTLLVPALLEARRRRRARRAGGPAGPAPRSVPDVGHAPRAARSPRAGGPWVGAPDPLSPRPADALTSAVATHLAPAHGRAARSAGDDPGAADRLPRTPEDVPPVPDLPDGCLAVVGPRHAALAAARAVLAELVATGAVVGVVHPDGRDADWTWCRWLPRVHRVRRPDLAGPTVPGRVLVVDDPRAPDRSAHLAAWWSAGTTERVLLVATEPASVPAWCRTVLDVRGGHWRWTLPDGEERTTPPTGVDVPWAERFARHVAAAAHRGRWPAGTGDGPNDADLADPTSPALPSAVSLVDLLDLPAPDEAARAPGTGPRAYRRDLPPGRGSTSDDATWIRARWAARSGTARSLAVPLGVGADGSVAHVDLLEHGPHALVAGTTGSGKSELLQSLVLGLALAASPRDLALALVDYKGGASFGECVRLPHVVGQVTDLEPGLAGRALDGLRAELRRREHVLADAGAARTDDLPPGTLPRLVVVIDEFRALADELPDFLPGLLRVAAQGRSLGVHLVLATQRPAGAVSADMRANITLRLALRVVDPADSQDVVESPHAARIPPEAPGRAVWRHGSAPPRVLQCAHAAGPPGPARDAVRAATPWGRPGATPVGSPGDQVARLVEAARGAAAAEGLRAAAPPWLPALPPVVRAAELADALTRPGTEAGGSGEPSAPQATGTLLAPARRTAPGLPIALGDVPAEQRRAVVHWDPAEGHLAVLGRARSGRTTALRAAAAAALAAGWHVHVLGAARDVADLRSHPGLGTVVDRHDPRRAARLLEHVAREAGTHRTLVVVDGVEDLRHALAAYAGGPGGDLLADVLASARHVAFALSTDGPTVAGLGHRMGPRLVLSGTDVHDDVALGVPGPLAGRGGRPGRAVWLGRGGPLACQVVLPEAPDAAGAQDGPGSSGTAGPGTRSIGTGTGVTGAGATGMGEAGAAVAGPLRLAPLPHTVTLEQLETAAGRDAPHGRVGQGTGGEPRSSVGALDAVPVGLGGDDGGPVRLDVGAGALVVGPPGSGRTTALSLLARAAYRRGVLRAVVARDDLLGDAGAGAHEDGGAPATEGGAGPDDGTSAVAGTDGAGAGAGAASVRRVGRFTPGPVAELLADLRRDDVTGGVVVVDDLDVLAQQCPLEVDALAGLCREGWTVLASASTLAAQMAVRGALAELRAVRCGIVLAPRERGGDEVFGVPLAHAGDVGPPRPGRGAAVQGRLVTPVQVAAGRAELSDSA